jgi:hypothetical protein
MRGAMLIGLVVAVWPRVAGVENLRATERGGIDLLLDAIAKVESHNDSGAKGDGGQASGVYQIHRAYWADGTKFLGVDWDYTQAADPVKARAVVRAYLLHYGPGCTLLEMARIHNGGPNGHHKPSTLEYARRIERVLKADFK